MNCSLAVAPKIEVTQDTLIVVACYIVVFILALFGNGVMILILLRNQLSKRRRVHSLLLHMTIAHLAVTLVYIPKEIIHNLTIVWLAGDTLCRLCKFFDAFAVALSANMLMCLSFDRFFSILYPFYAINAKKNVLRMISVAWLIAILTSLPQIYVFRTATHPCFDFYVQCVSLDVLRMISPQVMFLLSVLNVVEVYFLPLIVIVVFVLKCAFCLIAYSNWLLSDSWRGSKLLKGKSNGAAGTNQALLRRTGGQDNFERAKNRTLHMSIIVVLAFLFCWTPYTVAMFIHFLHSTPTHRAIPKLVSKLLYAFAVFNSAISPFLYCYFSFNIRHELEQLFCCVLPCNSASTSTAITTLAGRRKAIRQRPVNDHSLTNNSSGPLSPNTFSSCRNNTAINSSVNVESRATRVRLSNASKTLSFDEESSATTQVRRPSRLLVSANLPKLTDSSTAKLSFRTSPSNMSLHGSSNPLELKSNEAP